MRNLSRTLARMLLALCFTSILTGCEDMFGNDIGDPVLPGDDLLDDGYGPIELFDTPPWPIGGAFSKTGTPAFDIRGFGHESPIGVEVTYTDPSFGRRIPFAFDDVKYVARATAVLGLDQINTITGAYNNGRRNDAGDVVVLPSYATFTPENERYRFFQIRLNGALEMMDQRSTEPGRTRVVGIAFGNGEGGYVAAVPNTEDPFDGALLWMKATREPLYGLWTMDQRDWRTGTGVVHASSIRLLIRGDAAVAIVREAELQAFGATRFRWDVFSYTTNATTDWSHDFTEWESIDAQ